MVWKTKHKFARFENIKFIIVSSNSFNTVYRYTEEICVALLILIKRKTLNYLYVVKN